MKTKVFLAIAIRVILVFVIPMFLTFLTEELRGFFGDVPCSNNGCQHGFNIDSEWDWGARHYWYWWCGFFLWGLAVINCIVSVAQIVNKNYNL